MEIVEVIKELGVAVGVAVIAAITARWAVTKLIATLESTINQHQTNFNNLLDRIDKITIQNSEMLKALEEREPTKKKDAA